MSDILQAARSYYGLADTDVRKTDIYTNEAGQPMLVFELALSAEDFIAIGARMQNMQQPDTQPDTAIIEGPTVEAMRESYNALSKAEKGRYGSFARYMTECSTGIIDVYTGEPYNVPAPAKKLRDEFYQSCIEKGIDGMYRSISAADAEEFPELKAMIEERMAKAKLKEGMTGNMASKVPVPPAPPPTRTVINGRETKESIEATRVWTEKNKAAIERQVVHVDAPEEPEPVSMDAVWLLAWDATVAQITHASDSRYNSEASAAEYLIQWAMLAESQRKKHEDRSNFDAMHDYERSAFSSFDEYAHSTELMRGEKLINHMRDKLVEDGSHVWLRKSECTDTQIAQSRSSYKGQGYLVPIAMLTDEQKQKAKSNGLR